MIAPTPGPDRGASSDWLRSFVVAVAAATGAWIAGASAGHTHGDARPTWIVVGAVLTALAVGMPLWAQRRATLARTDAIHAALRAKTAMKVTLGDALDPLTQLILVLNDARSVDKPRIRGEAISLVVATAAQLADADRVRVCFLAYDAEPPASLRLERFAGRAGQPPSDLVEGTRVGNAALRALLSRSVTYVDDTAVRRGWWDTADGYGTFLALPVGTSARPFGMLTLDTLQSHGLADVDLALMTLLADLLAVALS